MFPRGEKAHTPRGWQLTRSPVAVAVLWSVLGCSQHMFDSLSQIRMALRRGWLFLRWKVKPQGREEVAQGGNQAALQEEEGDFLGFA